MKNCSAGSVGGSHEGSDLLRRALLRPVRAEHAAVADSWLEQAARTGDSRIDVGIGALRLMSGSVLCEAR